MAVSFIGEENTEKNTDFPQVNDKRFHMFYQVLLDMISQRQWR